MTKHGYLLPTRSVVFSSTSPAELTARTQADTIGLATRAEALGFDGVWVGDSVLAKPRHEPLTTLAAIATTTTAVTLGTAVYLPTLRHPVHVAHATATLDQLAGGRLALGVGVGVRPAERREHDQIGVPFHRRGARLNDALDVITQLWTGTPVTHDGESCTLENASIGFTPAHTPRIYAASAAIDPSSRFPPTIEDRFTQFADGWLPIAITHDEYAAGLDHITTLLEAAHRNPTRFDPAYYQDIVIADTTDEALDTARDYYAAYYGADTPAYDNPDTISTADITARGAFGPPAHIREHLDAYRDAGVTTFITRFASQDQRTQLQRYHTLLTH